LIVAVVDDVVDLCAAGRRFAGDGGIKKGESSGGSSEDGRAPSKDAVDRRKSALLGLGESKGAAVVDGWYIDDGLAVNGSSLGLATLVGREGDAGMLRLLAGRANGLEGRSSD
jgi:hypothetical protein